MITYAHQATIVMQRRVSTHVRSRSPLRVQAPVQMVFACIVGDGDLLYTVYRVPTVVICRAEQRRSAAVTLGLPPSVHTNVRALAESLKWRLPPPPPHAATGACDTSHPDAYQLQEDHVHKRARLDDFSRDLQMWLNSPVDTVSGAEVRSWGGQAAVLENTSQGQSVVTWGTVAPDSEGFDQDYEGASGGPALRADIGMDTGTGQCWTDSLPTFESVDFDMLLAAVGSELDQPSPF